MATYRTRQNGTIEATIRRAKLLPQPVYLTFDSMEEAERVCMRIEALLDKGIVPAELAKQSAEKITTLGQLIGLFVRTVAITSDDESILAKIMRTDGALALAKFDYDWVENWVTLMKRERNLSPSTIRKYVGALARCCDWGANKGIAAVLTHPMRRLPKGYSTYTARDAQIVEAAGKEAKTNQARDVRLASDEEARVEAVFDGLVPEGRQRGLKTEFREDKRDLFHLALDSCMRLREMATITTDQVDLKQQAVLLEKTKNGNKRLVPFMTDRMESIMRRRCDAVGPGGQLFPWWNGKTDQDSLRALSNLLSHQFSTVFELAGCAHVSFHTLRHEAISRLVEATSLSDVEISRISGHTDPRMMLRYSHLRASPILLKVRGIKPE